MDTFLGTLQLCLENRRAFFQKRQQLDAPEISKGPAKDYGQGGMEWCVNWTSGKFSGFPDAKKSKRISGKFPPPNSFLLLSWKAIHLLHTWILHWKSQIQGTHLYSHRQVARETDSAMEIDSIKRETGSGEL